MVEILFVGDIHLGRHPSRIPEALKDYQLEASGLSPTTAWWSTVAWALAKKVDALVLAGDVVESPEDRFEALGHLEKGVRQLAEAGIQVIGIAGNHDVLALPGLADRIDGFHLLGRGGKWESCPITNSAGECVDLLGWSFPTPQVPTNPLASLKFKPRPDVVTLGVLHGDLGKRNSVYAPLSRTELESVPVAGWLLGHIHRPDALEAGRPIGYLGALSAMDPGEPGLHGPWHMQISTSGIEEITQIPLAPIRYEALEINLENLAIETEETAADSLTTGLSESITQLHERLRPSLGHLRAVACRVVVGGRIPRTRFVAEAIEGDFKERITERDGVHYFIEKIIDESRPILDLQKLAGTDDPPGLLARKILALEEGGDASNRLVAQARPRLAKAWDQTRVEGVESKPPEVRAILLRAGYEALDSLLAQKPDLEVSP
ncbi:MAG: DNA repair exonuclease [Deltaproteobacteria bacterium]